MDGISGSENGFSNDENSVSDSVFDADLDVNSDSEHEVSDAEKFRNIRNDMKKRRQHIDGLAKAFDMDDEEKKRMLELIQELMPDPYRMSKADDVSERLSHGFEEMKARHPKLLFNRKTRRQIDVTDPKKFFMENKDLSGLVDSEEEIMRAILVNDRVLSGLNRWISEHEAMRTMLLSEMVRRSTLVEQWRHMLPKFMLPIYSMLFAAKASSQDLRVNTKLFNRIRDTIMEWSEGSVTRDELMSAAMQTEEEFMSVVEERDFSESVDDMEKCRGRLRFAYEDARKNLDEMLSLAEEGSVSSSDMDGLKLRVRRLEVVMAMDAGLDHEGRLVFSSLEDFAERSKTVAPSRRNMKQDDLPQEESVTEVMETEAVSVEEDVSDDVEVAEETSTDADDVSSNEETDHENIDALSQGDGVGNDDVFNDDKEEEIGDDGYGPDIPDDLFGTEPGVDPDEVLTEESKEETKEDSSSGGNEALGELFDKAGEAEPEDGSSEDVSSEGSVSDAGSEEGEYDELPSVEVRGDGMIFVPEMLDSVPTSYPDTLALAGTLPRSTGLSRSLSDKPFFKYGPNALKPPFTFVAFRRHPDLSSREGIEGTIEPVDLSRIELGDGDWVVSQMPGFSSVLGANHPLMLPPHSSLAWYGRKLGWSETEIRGLSAFGSPARPETITTKGDVKKLVDAMRGVARLRVDELAQKVPGHHLANKDGQELRDEAVEDLARWWIFILLARHRQADFELLLPKFFHNVQAPDFALMEDGTMNFGSGSNASRSIIFSIKLKNIVSSNDEETSAKMLGIGGEYSGARRLGV